MTTMDVPSRLEAMANTYRERNKVYGDNWRNVGAVMQQLHPKGIVLESQEDHELFHIWSCVVIKLTRFANSLLTHQDSVHDAAVYCAMIEALLAEREAQRKAEESEADLRARLGG